MAHLLCLVAKTSVYSFMGIARALGLCPNPFSSCLFANFVTDQPEDDSREPDGLSGRDIDGTGMPFVTLPTIGINVRAAAHTAFSFLEIDGPYASTLGLPP